MRVGDKVKILHSPYVNPSLQAGKTGRIVFMQGGGADIVMDDMHPDTYGDLDWAFDESELEVIA
jgi:hypothetical protein